MSIAHYTLLLIGITLCVWCASFFAMITLGVAGLSAFILANCAVIFVNVLMTIINITRI